MTTGVDTPVLIIGAGPVGLATAYVLGRYGVPSLVCEQYDSINPHPRAHVVNIRSMELFRDWGIADAILKESVGPEWGTVVWRNTLAGEEFGRIQAPVDLAEHFENVSPAVMASCAQDRVQQALLDAVRAQGVATVRYGTAVLDVDDRGSEVYVRLESKDGSREAVTARYAIAADGASGSVHRRMGIEMDGVPEFGHQINVYFHADLTRWTDHDPALLVWLINTTAPGGIVSMDGKRRWTYSFGYEPAEEDLSEYTHERCADLIRKAVGIEDLDVEVQSVGTWRLASQIARTYRTGNIFLAGDAAHQFPPTGGIGMNTGLADADNLGWKLAAVLNEWAPESVLDTYDSERRPVAVSNAEFSINNALKMTECGLGPTTVAIASLLESDDPVVAAAERLRLAEAIPQQREHFGSIDQEIGYIYGSGGPPAAPSDPRFRGSEGGRIPHCWVTRAGEKISTLDLTTRGFTLVVGPQGQSWMDAFGKIAGDIPREVILIGRDIDTDGKDPFGIDEHGAILIRPDAHIAWRAIRESTAPVQELARAFEIVFGSAQPVS